MTEFYGRVARSFSARQFGSSVALSNRKNETRWHALHIARQHFIRFPISIFCSRYSNFYRVTDGVIWVIGWWCCHRPLYTSLLDIIWVPDSWSLGLCHKCTAIWSFPAISISRDGRELNEMYWQVYLLIWLTQVRLWYH